MGLIKSDKKSKEGEVFIKWLDNRLIRLNKNVLGVNLGATGSGKSYRDLRMAELWYRHKFNREFPHENICFGVSSAIKLISSGKLRKGEVIIFEEAGVHLGSLDFQNKVSKMMTYVLQSFRSMNIAIFFNLPYMSMLNKSTRMLMHYSFESMGIDSKNKINKCKPFFHQVNQSTGKIYKKYPRVLVDGKTRTIKRFNFSMPSKELCIAYESMKAKFLADITKEYHRELQELEKEVIEKMGRNNLSEKQLEVFNLLNEGLTQTQIAKKLGKSDASVCEIVKTIKKKGFSIKKVDISLENQGFEVNNPLPLTV